MGGHSDTTVKKHIRLRSTTDAIYLSAPKKIVFTVGKSRLVLTPERVTLTSPEIWSVAEGQNHLKGGVEKLNCSGSPPNEGEEGKASGVQLKSANSSAAGGEASSASADAAGTATGAATDAVSTTTQTAQQGLGAKLLNVLGSAAEKVDVVGFLNDLKTSNSFLQYLKTAAIPGVGAFQKTLMDALKQGRLPTVQELKQAGVEGLSGGVSEVLGKAVSEHLPESWPEDARNAIVTLIKSSSQSAVSTAILSPKELDTWLDTFKQNTTQAAGVVCGAFAEQAVKEWLQKHASANPSLGEETLQEALPTAVRGVVSAGVPVVLDSVLK